MMRDKLADRLRDGRDLCLGLRLCDPKRNCSCRNAADLALAWLAERKTVERMCAAHERHLRIELGQKRIKKGYHERCMTAAIAALAKES